MAVAHRSDSYAESASATSITPAEPSGAAQDDILLMWVNVQSNSTFTGPTGGWTLLYQIVTTGSFRTFLYWIKRGSSAPGYQVTVGVAGSLSASVSCWSGCETNGWPFSQCKFNGNWSQTRANPDCPSVNTIVDNTIAVAFGCSASNAPTAWTMPSGYSVIEDGTGHSPKYLCVGYKSIGTAATEDPGAFSGAGGTNTVHEATVVLMPPQTGYPNFRSMTHAITHAGTNTITPTEPAGTVENDVLLYLVSTTNGTTFTSGPTGWTLLNAWASGSNSLTRLYFIRRGASAPSYTTTIASSAFIYREACVTCWSGVKTSGNGYGATNFTATRTAANPDTGSVTTTGDKSLVASLALNWTGATPSPFYTGPTGYADASNGSYVLDEAFAQNTNPDLGTFFKRVVAVGTVEDPGVWAGGGSSDNSEATVELLAEVSGASVLLMGRAVL